MSGLPETLSSIAQVEGWMTDAQAELLWTSAAGLARDARIVEIGSYHGRSAIVLARASADTASVMAIDPHAGNDRGPQQIEGTRDEGEADHQQFLENLRRAGVADAVRHVRKPSSQALGEVDGAIDLLYVDGAHRYAPARDDIARWAARVSPGGLLLIHDAFSSVGVTLAQARLLFFGTEFEYLGRAGSLVRYRRRPLSGRERAASTARQLAQLPWFARNVLVKAAIVLHLRPLVRALGHRDGPWPY